MRCMCHHFAKADARATPARWIEQIKAMEGMAMLDEKANHGGDIAKVIGLDSESEGSPQPELKEVAFFVGFNAEFKQAWRVLASDPDGET